MKLDKINMLVAGLCISSAIHSVLNEDAIAVFILMLFGFLNLYYGLIS